jgi:hypothetical protein
MVHNFQPQGLSLRRCCCTEATLLEIGCVGYENLDTWYEIPCSGYEMLVLGMK